MSNRKALINRDIRARRVVLIDSDGNRCGEFLRNDAISKAEDEGLDLVAVGGTSSLPVCKIMDYGKYLYSKKKSAKKSSVVKLKEVKIGFQSDDSYVELKTKQAEKFLLAGNKVKFTIRFRGREGSHADVMFARCLSIKDSLSSISIVDSEPQRGRRQISMILSPKK